MLLFPEAAIVAQAEPKIADQIKAVFAHWKQQHPRSFPRPHGEMPEWKKIRDRLRDGYTVAQLCRAIDGIHASPFHNGENDRGKSYVSLELCLRDAKHVEQFLELIAAQENAGGAVLSEKTQRGVRAVQSWVNRHQAQPPRIEQK